MGPKSRFCVVGTPLRGRPPIPLKRIKISNVRSAATSTKVQDTIHETTSFTNNDIQNNLNALLMEKYHKPIRVFWGWGLQRGNLNTNGEKIGVYQSYDKSEN